MIEKLNQYCKTAKSFIYEGSFSIYELLLKVIEKINEVIEFVNGFQSQLDAKEDSINITNNRKLSETGDFTGTWFGETKSSIDSRINNVESTYQDLIDLINSLTFLNIEIIDAQFFLSTDPITEIDAGLFTEAVTEEIDAGLFIYPCECSI